MNNFLNLIALVIKIGISVTILFFAALFLIIRPMDLFEHHKSDAIENEELVSELSHEEFIDLLTPHAQEVAQTHEVRPSLLVAQAALESNWGDSLLAEKSNNYFGIKDSTGSNYSTKEFENNEEIEIEAAFKQYDSLHESVVDYARLLSNGTSWDSDFYREVNTADNYEEAAIAIQEAGYATDPDYANKLIRIIEQYRLDELDS